jgi:hypothetical protein
VKYTRENVTPEAIMQLYERADDAMRDAAEVKRRIQDWHRYRDEQALTFILARLNDGNDPHESL